MYSTAYNLWIFTWFVHFELPFRLKGTEKIHTERLSKFPSNIYSILYASFPPKINFCKVYLIAEYCLKCKLLYRWMQIQTFNKIILNFYKRVEFLQSLPPSSLPSNLYFQRPLPLLQTRIFNSYFLQPLPKCFIYNFQVR